MIHLAVKTRPEGTVRLAHKDLSSPCLTYQFTDSILFNMSLDGSGSLAWTQRRRARGGSGLAHLAAGLSRRRARAALELLGKVATIALPIPVLPDYCGVLLSTLMFLIALRRAESATAELQDHGPPRDSARRGAIPRDRLGSREQCRTAE